MNICDAGQILIIRGIVFNDGYWFDNGTYSQNYCDSLDGHPGIALLPTDEMDDRIYAIHMTSDTRRARRNSKKHFTISDSKAIKKKSHINLAQIVTIKNGLANQIQEYRRGKCFNVKLSIDEYNKVLHEFYDYHTDDTTKDVQDEQSKKFFNDIKSKIEIMMKITDLQIKVNEILNNKIEYPQIDTKVLKLLEKMDKERRNKIIDAAVMAEIPDTEKREDVIGELYNYEEKKEIYQALKNANQLNAIPAKDVQDKIKEMYEKMLEPNLTEQFLKEIATISNLLEKNPARFNEVMRYVEEEGNIKRKAIKLAEEEKAKKIEGQKCETDKNNKYSKNQKKEGKQGKKANRRDERNRKIEADGKAKRKNRIKPEKDNYKRNVANERLKDYLSGEDDYDDYLM